MAFQGIYTVGLELGSLLESPKARALEKSGCGIRPVTAVRTGISMVIFDISSRTQNFAWALS
jgi:hypothetical protein